MAAMLGPISSIWDSSWEVPGNILVRSLMIGVMASPGMEVQM